MRLRQLDTVWESANYSEENIKIMEKYGLKKTFKDGKMAPNGMHRIDARLSDICACINDMVLRLVNQKDFPFCKLVIEIWEDEVKHFKTPLIDWSGICELGMLYSPWRIFDATEVERKKIAVDIIEKASLKLENDLQLDMASLLKACESIKLANYENKWVWKRKQSKSRLTAEVTVVHTTETIEIWMTVYSPKGQMLRHLLVNTQNANSNSLKDHYLGDLFWTDDVATLTSSEGFNFSVDMNSGKVSKTEIARPSYIEIY